MSKIAFLFPGQGAQSVGMASEVCQEVPAARELFARANAILGYDLLELCLNGPADKLNSTVVSQPALYVAGLAAVEKLRQSDPSAVDSCAVAAGLSLGEYTALAFAEAFSFEDGLRVVQARGSAMQSSADANPSSMASVLGMEIGPLEEITQSVTNEVGLVRIANFLCPKNLVVSGTKEGVAEVCRRSEEAGALQTIPLAVAGAFHTDLMKPADQKLAEVLESVDVRPPRIPVLSNVDGAAHTDPAEIKRILVKQVLSQVQWEASMRRMLEEGVDRFYELGPGRVLAGLMKRIHRKADFVNVTV